MGLITTIITFLVATALFHILVPAFGTGVALAIALLVANLAGFIEGLNE